MSVRVSAIQMCSQRSVEANLEQLSKLVAEAATGGAQLVVLPENFAYLGPETGRIVVAEDLDELAGPVASCLSDLARRHGAWIVAGGMAERSSDPEKPYQTCAVFGPDGALLTRYRKIHLFDVDLGRGTTFCEPRFTTAGREPVLVELLGIRLGLSVCYDLRFPELYRALAADGAHAFAVPAAFTLTTGKDHWLPLLRARAIENQAYVFAAAQWGQHGERTSWGKTCMVDPWGAVIAQASESPGVVSADVDLQYLQQVRARLPALQHRRLPA